MKQLGSRQNHHENRLDIQNERVQVFKERTDIQAEETKEVKRLLESDVAKWTSIATGRDQLESRMAVIELRQKENEKVAGEDWRLGRETQGRNAVGSTIYARKVKQIE